MKFIIAVLSFFVIIFAYVMESSYFNGYLDFGAVLRWGGLIGGALGLGIGIYLWRILDDDDSKFSLFTASLILGIVLGPLVTSISNRLLSTANDLIEYEVIEIYPVMKSAFGVIKDEKFIPDGHELTIRNADGKFNIEIGPDLSKYQIDDDSIFLKVNRGFWGFKYISPVHEIASTDSKLMIS